MEIRHPYVIYIGLPLLIILFIVLHIRKKKKAYQGGLKIANTEWIRQLSAFQSAKRKRKFFSLLFKLGLVLCLISSLLLSARFFVKSEDNSGIKKRDIFLCLDVSYSIYELNYDLVDQLKSVVEEMDGDRFGISIFNTSTVLYVPLTDDYDFVLSKLDELKEYFLLQKEYMKYADLYTIPYNEMEHYASVANKLYSIDAGTLVNNFQKGSSLIGEGLASCLYSFPHLEDESRTRIIILSTDNSEQALKKPLVDLPKASEYCHNHQVHLFGIYPSKLNYDKSSIQNYEINQNHFENSFNNVDGIVYVESESLKVKDIVNDIQKHEAMVVKQITSTKLIDQPETFVGLFMIGLLMILISGGLLVKE